MWIFQLLRNVFEFVLKSKGVKVSSAVGGGTGVVALVFTLYGHVDSKAAETKFAVEEYVDQKHEIVMSDIKEIKNMLIRIDDRLYNLNR